MASGAGSNSLPSRQRRAPMAASRRRYILKTPTARAEQDDSDLECTGEHEGNARACTLRSAAFWECSESEVDTRQASVRDGRVVQSRCITPAHRSSFRNDYSKVILCNAEFFFRTANIEGESLPCAQFQV